MEFEILISQEFLKKSYTRRLFRNWWKYFIAFALIFIAILLEASSKSFGHLSTVGLTLIIFCIMIYSVLYYKQMKYIKNFTDKQGETAIKYRLTEETIETESFQGKVALKWDSFKSLRIEKKETLLEFAGSGELTLPTIQLSDEVLSYLIERFSLHGKKITDNR